MEITELRDNIFYAELVFAGGARVSARPWDAIALALRSGAPIRCAEAGARRGRHLIPDEQEDEVEKFREFLDTISPEDSLVSDRWLTSGHAGEVR